LYIARGILKNKSQIEIPDEAENRTRLRTEQDKWNGDQEAKANTDWQKKKT